MAFFGRRSPWLWPSRWPPGSARANFSLSRRRRAIAGKPNTSADARASASKMLPILFVTRYGRNAHYPHMSGRSVGQAGRGAGILRLRPNRAAAPRKSGRFIIEDTLKQRDEMRIMPALVGRERFRPASATHLPDRRAYGNFRRRARGAKLPRRISSGIVGCDTLGTGQLSVAPWRTTSPRRAGRTRAPCQVSRHGAIGFPVADERGCAPLE
jgi:hypothetical protein